MMNEFYRMQLVFYDIDKNKKLDALKSDNFSLYQIGDNYYINQYEIPPHRQLFDLEITIVMSGSCEITADDRTSAYCKNDIHLAFKDEIHSIHIGNSCRIQYLSFDFSNKSKHKKKLSALKQLFKNSRLINHNDIISNAISAIINFTNINSEYISDFIDCKITEILTILCSNYEFLPNIIVRNDNNNLVSQILSYLDANYLRIISQAELSRVFSYSYQYLSSLFSKSLNISIKQYLLSKRMNYARKLLINNKSVTEISNELSQSYTSIYNFSRAFKNYFGESPSQYIRTHKSKEN